MLTLKVLNPRDVSNFREEDCPKEYNGVPIYRKPIQLGLDRCPKGKIYLHPYGFKLIYVEGKGYIILCTTVDCINAGSETNIKCRTHGKMHNTCKFLHCQKKPSYGFRIGEKLRCSSHKEDGMFDITKPICNFPNCTTRANYGVVKGTPTRCKSHSITGMGNVTSKLCGVDGCTKQPAFGFRGYSTLRCKAHKTDGMENLLSKRCELEGCVTIAVFGLVHGKPLRCKAHIIDGMVDVVNKKCEVPGCIIQPCFGFAKCGYIRCSSHRLEGMINVRDNFCTEEGCVHQPCFSFGGPPSRCSSHKSEGMINVKHKKCDHFGCNKIPSFGFIGNKASRCKTHKLENMTDVCHKMCEETGCLTRANFGNEGGSPTRCSKHKINGMLNISFKSCEYDGCNIHPSYHKLYSVTFRHCVRHSSLNEYGCDKGIPICKFLGCNNIAYFVAADDRNMYPVRCETHKLSEDLKLVEKECQTCEEVFFFPESRESCMDCGKYRDRVLYHFKESIIKSFFTTNNIKFIHDRPIEKGKYNFRPDFLICSDFGYIIVEIDEFQHKRGYNHDSEISRMNLIFSDLRQNNSICSVLFIRYNPDDYIGTCFDTTQREKYLYEIVDQYKNIRQLGIELGVIYMFYDGFTGTSHVMPVNRCDLQSYNNEPDFDKVIE